jgi:hypothetical protein
MRRRRAQPGDKLRHQHGSGIFGTGQGKAPVGSFRDELARGESQLKLEEALAQARRDLGSPLGRLHAVRAAHEQFVLQHVAQPVQCVTDRRLGQTELRTGPRCAALHDQRLEDLQQVEIEALEIQRLHCRCHPAARRAGGGQAPASCMARRQACIAARSPARRASRRLAD